MSLPFENANELSGRVWTGSRRRRVSETPSNRRQHTVAHQATAGTRAHRPPGHRDEVAKVSTSPVTAEPITTPGERDCYLHIHTLSNLL